MIEKKTTIDQIEIASNGVVQVRMQKQLIEDGKVLAERLHRTSIAPGQNIDGVMAAVNAHLEASGYAPVADYERLRQFCAVAHSPEVVEAFMAG
jgi:hypothetical protein